MRIFRHRTLLTAALFLGLGFAAAQTEQTAPAAEPTTITLPSGALTLPGLEGATFVSSFTTILGGGVIYRGSVADAVDRYAQALTAAGFTAEGSSGAAAATGTAETTDTAATGTDAAAGTTAATGTTDTSTAASGTTTTGTTDTSTAAAGTTTTGTTDTTTAAAGTTTTTDTSTAAAGTTDAAAAATTDAAATAEGPTGLPDGPAQVFVRNGERIQLRAYERGGLTVVVISRLGTAATGTTTSGG